MNKKLNKKNESILELKNITKKYPGVVALNNVSFKVEKNKILALVGENGAGKSTLLKVISGVIPKSKFEGQIFFEGNDTSYHSVKDSEKDGIAIIHQELAISPKLKVYENIFVGNYIARNGITNWSEMIKQARHYMNMVGLNIDPNEIAGNLSIANQQLLEIAKALAKKSKLLILDEPTSSLNDEDSFALLDLMKKLRDKNGVSCIFVSHKLKEVEYVADSITVIRDGKHISDYNNQNAVIKEETLIKDIVGRTLENKFPKKLKGQKIGGLALEVQNWTVEDSKVTGKLLVKNASFNVRRGEIVGISGLVGSGRSELCMNIFGKSENIYKSGYMKLHEKKVSLNSSLQAIKNHFMYASEDRKNLGLIQIFSIHENISLSALHLYSNKVGVLKQNEQIQNSKFLKYKLNIKVPNINYKVETLSGGNQQKVLLAKAMSTEFDILIIDEPTKGIDVGSKFEIYKIIQDFAKEGKAIVIISSEIEEILGITNRLYVMSQGEIKGELETNKATPEKIMQIAIGQNYRKEKNI